jgi:hypothetical protein
MAGVASRGGSARGPIASRIAQAWVAQGATQGRPTARTPHRPCSPSCPCGHFQARVHGGPGGGDTHHALPRDASPPWEHTRKTQCPHRGLVPREAIPTQRSAVRLLVLAMPELHARGKLWI